MTYQEKEITKDKLEKSIQTLDLDEGIRIENRSSMIFINKSAKRYCVNISKNGKDEFVYYDTGNEVLQFLLTIMGDCKIYYY